jgi:hypothetical protein
MTYMRLKSHGGKKRAKYVKPRSATIEKLFQKSSSSNSESECHSGGAVKSGITSECHSVGSVTSGITSECHSGGSVKSGITSECHSGGSVKSGITSECHSGGSVKSSITSKLADNISETNTNKSQSNCNRNIIDDSIHDIQKYNRTQSKSFTSVISISASDCDLPMTKKVVNRELRIQKKPNFKLEFMIRSGRLMTLQDKNSVLKKNAWLEANVVDGFLECVETEKCAMWKDSDWRQVNKMQPPNSMYKVNWEKVETIYIPLCESGHFTALLINIKERNFSMLDTLSHEETLDRNCRAYTAKWNKFVSLYLPNLLPLGTRFATSCIEHPMQRDGSSCGILVALFGRSIAVGEIICDTPTDAGSMLEARKEIWQTLLHNRDTERCCTCRRHNDMHSKTTDPDKWLLCSLCGNCVHFGCAKADFLISEDENSKKWLCNCCKNAV